MSVVQSGNATEPAARRAKLPFREPWRSVRWSALGVGTSYAAGPGEPPYRGVGWNAGGATACLAEPMAPLSFYTVVDCH